MKKASAKAKKAKKDQEEDKGDGSILSRLDLPGFSHAKGSKVRKAIWTILVGIGIALTTKQVYETLKNYFSYPTVTKVW